MPTLWEPLRPVPHPRRLLFVAPHVGSGAAAARDLAHHLPDDWAVHGLVLPGRERRFAEPPAWTFEDTVVSATLALEEVAVRYPGTPLVGLGQCSGAWLMYAILARAASDLRSRRDLMVAVSQGAWHLPRVHPDLPDSSEAMWAQMVASGDVPRSVADDEDARDLLEPVIRSDYAAVADFPTEADPLDLPILVVVGAGDRDIDRSVAHSWVRYGTGLEIEEVAAGHFPLRDDPVAVARAIVAQVDPATSS
ncbi:MAG: thioesterase domain-containing protein [Nocardioides sp.]|uniref:thioesterase II family protein n=1 Tax=Nocardioides sp. TaxID=35761 RepID=UPI002387DF31|nr:alpha/beta fold hydrolase [Nocardioides sp.]MDE0775682.1 thioesterase domain-containing protein [Nocardioides sp.]